MRPGVRWNRSRSIAVDDQLQRLGLLNRHKDQVRKFRLDPRGLKFSDPRRTLRGGKKPQPRVQKITLSDRFDDRRVGALEVQGFKSNIDNKTSEPSTEGEKIW